MFNILQNLVIFGFKEFSSHLHILIFHVKFLLRQYFLSLNVQPKQVVINYTGVNSYASIYSTVYWTNLLKQYLSYWILRV
jgi:hypothetical protein